VCYGSPMPRTIVKAVRVDPLLWEAAREKAGAKGDNVNAVIVRALRRYAKPTPEEPVGGP